MTVAHNSLRGREWNCLWAVGEKIQFQERVLHFFNLTLSLNPSPIGERRITTSYWEKLKISSLNSFKKSTLSLCPSPIGEGRITTSSWAKRRISNLSVRIEIPKQVRNDSCAQLSPRERVKLSLSRWRKDTISREGSLFFQSDPLPLSLSHRRGKNYHVILS